MNKKGSTRWAMLRVCNMLKVSFRHAESKIGTDERKLKNHIGTDHSFCAQRQSDLAEKLNLLSAVTQFTFSIFLTISIAQPLVGLSTEKLTYIAFQ